jgi:hypothetical protein
VALPLTRGDGERECTGHAAYQKSYVILYDDPIFTRAIGLSISNSNFDWKCTDVSRTLRPTLIRLATTNRLLVLCVATGEAAAGLLRRHQCHTSSPPAPTSMAVAYLSSLSRATAPASPPRKSTSQPSPLRANIFFPDTGSRSHGKGLWL